MKKFIFAALVVLFSSCTNQIKESQELRNELRSRELELSSILGSPGYKIGQALEYYQNEDYQEAIKWINDLENNFPDWNKEIVALVREKVKAKTRN